METFNAFGFTNFWGVTPAYDILQNEFPKEEIEINILLSNTNDIRHILKTLFQNFEKKRKYKLRFYLYERHKENIARSLAFFHIINDIQLSLRDRIELFMEIYGNTLLSSRTADYLNLLGKKLINFITSDKKYTAVMKKIVDMSNLSFREKDEIAEIFKAYDIRIPFDIEKYRDDRLRYMFKERYDYRENLIDWDYVYKLKDHAPVVNKNHYTKFRLTGVTFEMRINSYHIPNRTLSSYIPGKTKEGKDSCLVRGFWGDITNSPFIGFGVELSDEDEHETFYAKTDIHYKFHSQHITEWNLSRYFTRLEKDELYKLKFTDHKIPKKNSILEEGKNEEEISVLSTDVTNSDNKEETNNLKEGKKDEFVDPNSSKLIMDKNKITENETSGIDIEKLKLEDNKLIQTENENKSNEKFSLENENNEKILIGFEYFETKIYTITGEVDQFFKKKKYKNFFDYVVLGFHSKNLFDKMSGILKKDGKVLAELNTYMAAFEQKDKDSGKETYKFIGKEHGFVLDDQSCKYMWKYIYMSKNENEDLNN